MSRARRVMPAVLLVFGLLWIGWAGPAGARTAVVRLHDGRTFEGAFVSQTNESIVLNIRGIQADIKQSEVADVSFREEPAEIFARRRAALVDSDLAGRFELVRQMYDLDALEIADGEAAALDREFPDHPAITELRTLIDAKARLAANRVPPRRLQQGATAERPSAAQRREDQPRLTAKQINLIKVFEIDLSTEPRVTVPPETLNKLFERYADNSNTPRGREAQRAFRREPGWRQLELLFRLQARELYAEVQVPVDPQPLSDFRHRVNPRYVASYFEPHFGRGQVEGLTLLNDRPNDTAEAYTNFYLLTRFSHDGFKMIDRATPRDSLLLQWGLPREAARKPAPEVEGWQPRFRSTEDAEYQRLLAWVNSLYKQEPDYGITYPPAEERE